MPTEQSPETNKYRCGACGRFFNTEGELRKHQRDCVASQQSGGPKPEARDPEKEPADREWFSTP
jgi:hypothetical protein